MKPPAPPKDSGVDRRRRTAALSAQRPGLTARPVHRITGRSCDLESAQDLVTVEAALQIQLAGDPFLTTMRTPGRDHDLALGLLFAEGLIEHAEDVSTIAHCGRPTDEGYGHTLDVTPGPGHAFDPERVVAARRVGHAGCGVCGRTAIADLLSRCQRPPPPRNQVPRALLWQALGALQAQQCDFSLSGGCHAAAALDNGGKLLAHAEDVGRHNAVDKAIGAILRERPAPRAAGVGASLLSVLAVSGRASFELAQKAVAAGAQVLCSVSAPSSLAIDVAEAAGLCLVGFARDGQANVYTHPTMLHHAD